MWPCDLVYPRQFANKMNTRLLQSADLQTCQLTTTMLQPNWNRGLTGRIGSGYARLQIVTVYRKYQETGYVNFGAVERESCHTNEK